ncbi:MAG: ATP-binding cassette domain-containing protein [Proteobacteria bacterium]|nr:ATP-binding cassette domain-containing protein [Pseudomonadota bacterium]
MPVLGAKDLVKHYGERVVLDRVALAIEAGERVGLVGMNGSGKSTLAKILAGLDEADRGQVTCARQARLAYLDQVPRLDGDRTALELVLSGLDAWSRAVARYDQLSAEIASTAGAGESAAGDSDNDRLTALLAAQSEVGAEVERLGGWDLRHQAEAMLGHLGIAESDRRVDTMSGGEKRRVALARLLVAQPQVAILDEPTNHLDIDTIEWLERYLANRFTGALLLITHDRYLLDRIVTRTLEIEDGALYSYQGGWEQYLVQRAERQAHAERVAANRRNLLRRELEWLRRSPKARTGKQKARIDRAVALIDGPRSGREEQKAAIKVDAVRSGRSVLDLDDLAVAIEGRALVERLTLSLGKGERVGIVGKNGSGKTTLLRVLMGELEPAGGVVALGKNTRIAYLDQQRSDLDDTHTVFDSVAEGRSHVRLGGNDLSIHAYLERFLFRSSDQQKKVSSLSGGERARVALARTLRDQTNLVILDEPTNDLDVATLAAVEQALLDFPGTVLVVTHDRWFLDRVATSILAFEVSDDGRPEVVHVHGNYQRYLDYRGNREQTRQRAESARRKPDTQPARGQSGAGGAAAVKKRGLTYGERLELDGLLDRIEAAEAEATELEAELDTPGFYQLDHVGQKQFLDKLADKKRAAEALIERWTDLESRNQES